MATTTPTRLNYSPRRNDFPLRVKTILYAACAILSVNVDGAHLSTTVL